ncbi:Fic family protein [Leifsonia shinshuensis]|uniref:Fic family protein n=1 Tax=Leifsonia shinshuensis TaxID=150026 RepID=A0A7G6YDH6_9MICO|nr:Fic family protein [Leifsonia shinshuensis]QNE36541.1 Fic family protein [Leifsonia shinshuensis]
MSGANDWVPHGVETISWRSRSGRGARADRMLTSVEATIPPFIAELVFVSDPSIQVAQEAAIRALAELDADTGPGAGAISAFLIRTESIASSKIEHIEATTEDFARALAGVKANTSATAMVSASNAIMRMVDDAGRTGRITLDSMFDAHRTLLSDDPSEAPYAGQVRGVQNWIGGSDFSPLGAEHVPPAVERVLPLLHDLIAFSNRDDIPVVAQAAIAHAQFESIHPFTDGNGRIGRALIGAIYRRRGLTSSTTPPVASALAADQDGYFELLTAYRRGVATPIVRELADATRFAAEEALVSVRAIRELPEEWEAGLAPRAGSALSALVEGLLDTPVFDAESAEARIGRSTSATYEALERLEDAGITLRITNRQRNRVWAVTAIIDELDSLDWRIAARARARSAAEPREPVAP